MTKTSRKLMVDTSPTKTAVVSSLTRDITVDACIFDLIDNSIDAARNRIFKQTTDTDTSAGLLPASYADCDIAITLDDQCFTITDNCGGIEAKKFKDTVLKFGQRSAHKMGIGHFGVGLNRALFKLGKVSHLRTDNGTERVELILDTKKYLADLNWELPAQVFSTSGTIGTTIEIRQLPVDISREFADANTTKSLIKEIGKRYGRYLKKGLTITVNSSRVTPHEIEIREDGPYEPEYKSFKTPEGVYIRIACGQHVKHRFSAEPDYNKASNSALTEEYGWSIFCNDREIVMADRSWKTGWDTQFHSEFYGFVGFVEFVCEDPSLLPWNTTKTDVDLNNAAYQTALEEMRTFAQRWRTNALDAKNMKRKKQTLKPRPSNPKSTSALGSAAAKPASTATAPTSKPAAAATKPTVKQDATQFFTILPSDIDEKHCYDKNLKLVHEAKNLELSNCSYAGLALIRMLFETTVHVFFERNKQYDVLKAYSIAERNKGRGKPLTADEEKKLVPNLDEICAYLENNPSVWGTAKANHLKHSMNKMVAHKKILNGVMHNPFQQVNSSTAFQIRDEVLPLLRHLIEN